MKGKIRFAKYVYDEIMSGNFHHYDATKLTRFTNGSVSTKEYYLSCRYSWFGLKKHTVLTRTDIDNDNWRTVIRINLRPDEDNLLWSVWPTVEEYINECRAEETKKRKEYNERMQWWP